MDIEETNLPGVGVRHDFTTRAGRQLGVVTHRTGRRDLLVYDRADPDACQEVIQLTDEEADTLADLLGAARLTGRLAALTQQVAAAGAVGDHAELAAGAGGEVVAQPDPGQAGLLDVHADAAPSHR